MPENGTTDIKVQIAYNTHNLSIKNKTSFSNPYGCRVPKKDDLSYENGMCTCVLCM